MSPYWFGAPTTMYWASTRRVPVPASISWVMPSADPPQVPIFPLHHGCRASHSTVSKPSCPLPPVVASPSRRRPRGGSPPGRRSAPACPAPPRRSPAALPRPRTRAPRPCCRWCAPGPVGKGPSPGGRKTSVASCTPSRMATWSSASPARRRAAQGAAGRARRRGTEGRRRAGGEGGNLTGFSGVMGPGKSLLRDHRTLLLPDIR